MAAWGYKSFENDDALDYLAEVEDSLDDMIFGTLSEAAEADQGDLEAPAASEALVAAEIVAASITGKTDRLPQGPDGFLAALGNLSELQLLAMKACKRILADSELADLWSETEDFAAWKADVETLIGRLK